MCKSSVYFSAPLPRFRQVSLHHVCSGFGTTYITPMISRKDVVLMAIYYLRQFKAAQTLKIMAVTKVETLHT